MTVRENKEGLDPSTPKTLKLTESMLLCDGEYVGEIGNRDNPAPPDMFEWNTDEGLKIKTKKINDGKTSHWF